MPNFKKFGGRIYGVQFTAKEQAAIDKEIKRQCAEYDQKNLNELDALILWLLHEEFGFGMKRLRRFYELFHSEFSELVKRYELEEDDAAWLCTYKLKQYGLDIEQWNKEGGEDESGHV